MGRIVKRQSARIRWVGAQLLAGQASYMQRVLTTDPSAQPEFYAQQSNHDNARICRRQGLPDCHGAGTSVRGCMPRGPVILTAKYST